jgi:hypothetical protein
MGREVWPLCFEFRSWRGQESRPPVVQRCLPLVEWTSGETTPPSPRRLNVFIPRTKDRWSRGLFASGSHFEMEKAGDSERRGVCRTPFVEPVSISSTTK